MNIRTAMFVVLLMAGCGPGSAVVEECPTIERIRSMSLPSADVMIVPVRTGDRERTDLYLRMPYDRLRFERTGNGFSASYSVRFVFRNAGSEIVSARDIDRSVTATNYEETRSARSDLFLQSFTLPSEVLSAEIVVQDQWSSLISRRRYAITVRERWTDSIPTVSGILFSQRLMTGANGIILRPMVPASFSLLTDSLGLFQELYGVHSGDRIEVCTVTRIRTFSAESVEDYPHLLPPYRTLSSRCSRLPDSVTAMTVTVLTAVNDGPVQLMNNHPLPPAGGSTLERTIIMRGKERTDTLQASFPLFRQERIMTTEESAVMRYLLRDEENDSLRTLRGERREHWVNSFWEPRGGPERRTEFLRRIADADRLFSTCVQGSVTPRGIVFILAGMPEAVDCRGGFTEVWYYSLGDRTYPVEFRITDERTGEAELAPYSISDTLWQYILDRWRRRQ